jgi:histidyl-tRNA synthetase
VYEVFDLQPDNNRSMFGGERFDKLIKIFGDKYDLTATGFGMGDYTLIEFLNAWKLVPEFDHEVMVMVTVFSLELLKNSWNVALQLRKAKINTLLYPDSTAPLPRQLRYAHKKNIPWVVVVGPDEVRAGKVSLKNMESGKQKTVEMDRLVDRLRSNAE